MDVDPLNQHECMTNLVTLINHMVSAGISPRDGAPPAWMQYLQKKFVDPGAHLNVRLFIARLVVNCGEIFQPFAKCWLGPLVQFIVCGDNGGQGIHAMVVDLVVTVLSWAGTAIPEVRFISAKNIGNLCELRESKMIINLEMFLIVLK